MINALAFLTGLCACAMLLVAFSLAFAGDTTAALMLLAVAAVYGALCHLFHEAA